MTAPIRTPRTSNLTDVYVDNPSMVMHAMENDGTWGTRLPGGHTVVFHLEGDYLHGRVTAQQADIMRRFSLFEVEGQPRKADPVQPIENFFAEGERLKAERQHGAGGGKSGRGESFISELAQLIGQDRAAEMLAGMMGERMEAAISSLAERQLAEQEAKRAALNTEFSYARLAPHLTEDDSVALLNEFEPGLDPATVPHTARVTLLGRTAATDSRLAATLRDLVGRA